MKDVKNQKEFDEVRKQRVGGLSKLVPSEAAWYIMQCSYLAGVFAFIIFLFIAIF